MPVLEAKLSSLNEYVGKKLTVTELEQVLTDMGLELDGFDESEGVARIELTAERPDLLSPQGMARALRSYLGIKPGLEDYHVERSALTLVVDESVKKVRPYTAAMVVKGLEFTDEKIKEIVWVQEKIHDTFGRGRSKAAIGVYPLEKIDGDLTYSGEDPKKLKFLPLEELKEMTGEEILEKHSKGKAFKHLLEGHKKYPVFRDSTGRVLSMPPVINSQELGKVTAGTKDVFVEVSGKELRDVTETLNILAVLFYDLGGQICSVDVKYPKSYPVDALRTPHLKPSEKRLRPDYVNEVLGSNYTFEEIKYYLEKMGFGVVSASEKELKVLIPAYRVDILHEIDLVDDVMRGATVQSLKPSLPNLYTTAGVTKETILEEKLRENLQGHGFQEVLTFALTNSKDQYDKMLKKPHSHIEVPRAASEEFNMVRTWLAPELLKVFSNNAHKSFPQKIFEVEDVVLPDKKADVRARNVTKCCALTSHAKASFTEAKSLLESLCKTFDWKLELKEKDFSWCLPGRSAEVKVNGKPGWIGELHPEVLENWNVNTPASGFEFELTY